MRGGLPLSYTTHAGPETDPSHREYWDTLELVQTRCDENSGITLNPLAVATLIRLAESLGSEADLPAVQEIVRTTYPLLTSRSPVICMQARSYDLLRRIAFPDLHVSS